MYTSKTGKAKKKNYGSLGWGYLGRLRGGDKCGFWGALMIKVLLTLADLLRENCLKNFGCI